ncbi:hypothetical protein GYA93_22775 [Gordonia desulfuricans]|uniref:Pentapeptide repeat-containing protein n=1 Tax=Gordonia desulfuricans TaxID=89051 RepID=A0A7K3LWP0_9ACTN|nr:pentapeptide repeat-containing protein [Gordonia desulfuricans]NDK92361.1 hypothetical protein [Gordonia desulfuricans]
MDGEATTDAERQLLEAVSAGGGTVDLRTRHERSRPEPPSPDDAATWGSDRTVRAGFLQHLLLTLGTPIALYGARIDGDLDLDNTSLPSINLTQCIVDGHAWFNHAIFTGGAWFDRATFTGVAGFNHATFTNTTVFLHATFTRDAGFNHATFTRDAGFDRATFTRDAGFEHAIFTRDARFNHAIFTGNAVFEHATFTGAARFDDATFTGVAVFDHATFTGDAGFTDATFTSDARFTDATFTGDARFDRATFTGDAGFDRATFTSDAGFYRATFTGDAGFYRATFTGDAKFTDAIFAGGAQLSGCRFRRLELVGTVWSGPLVTVGLVAGVVDVSAAVFDVPVRVELVAGKVLGQSLRANHRFHLVLAAARLDLTAADLAPGSLIEAMEMPALADRFVSIPPLFDNNGRVAKPSPVMRFDEFLGIILEHYRLDTYLRELFAGPGPAGVCRCSGHMWPG